MRRTQRPLLLILGVPLAIQIGGLRAVPAMSGNRSSSGPDPIGSVSVEQLYAKGWRVVSVSRMNDKGAYYAVIIETQGR